MKLYKLYDFRITSELCNIRDSVNNIVDFIVECFGPVKEDILFEVRVILNELFQNAIRHGNKEDRTKQVKVRVGIADTYVYFIIEDEGDGFECRCMADSNGQLENVLELCNMKESGRGILIVKNLCDKVKFNAKGNKIIVLKRLN